MSLFFFSVGAGLEELNNEKKYDICFFNIDLDAENNGVFGNRPTWGVGDLTGAIPLSLGLDTPGFLARDPKLWSAASDVAYSGLTKDYSQYPRKLLTYNLSLVDDNSSTSGQQIVRHFLRRLAKYLSADIVDFNYTAEWTKSRPDDTLAILDDLVGTTWATLAGQQQVEDLAVPFLHDYAANHSSRKPYLNPSTNGSWSCAEAFPDEIAIARANRTVFAEWWNNVALPGNQQSCSDR